MLGVQQTKGDNHHETHRKADRLSAGAGADGLHSRAAGYACRHDHRDSRRTRADCRATTETPAVQDTLTPIYTTWGAAVGQDAVYSAMNIDDAGQYFATTIDFSTGEQRILCKKLGCSHADESCPAT